MITINKCDAVSYVNGLRPAKNQTACISPHRTHRSKTETQTEYKSHALDGLVRIHVEHGINDNIFF